MKRAFSFIIAFAAIVILSPLMLILLILNSITVKGNPFFTQQRIGKNEKPFKIYKLKTLKEEQYIGKFSVFLRRTSLDELPQFFNILKGDMNLVGPRPLVPEEKKTHIARSYLGIYNVRPGLTGLAQVSGHSRLSDEQRLYWDCIYIQNNSWLLDIKIIWQTIIFMFKQKNE